MLETVTEYTEQKPKASDLNQSRLETAALTSPVAGHGRMEVALKTIYTLGYQGAALPDFVRTLKETGISLLLDVRELPQSRRPGFSKRVLSEALEDAGIIYRHMRQLGDPKPGRDAARRGAMDEFRSIFNAHLDLEASQTALREVAQQAGGETIALMCYERAHDDCHRSLVAQRLVRLCSFKVMHLGVHAERPIGRDNGGAIARKFVGTR